jgi:MFS family permease
LRKHLSDPGTIAFLTSLNMLFNFLVGTAAAYFSDRLSSRWGRRKPFIVAGFTGAAGALALIPLAQTFAHLVALIVVFHLCVDLAQPWESLFYDVVPGPQRGRAATIRLVIVQLGLWVFSAVLVGQFDQRYETSAGMFTGEHVLYWTVALVMLLLAGLVAALVHELPSESNGPTADVARPGGFLSALVAIMRDIFGSRQAVAVYLLYVCPLLATAPQNTLQALIHTEQFGLTKRELGLIAGLTLPVGLVVFIPLAGLLADRVPRLLLFRLGIALPLVAQLALFSYARWAVDYQVPFGVLVAHALVMGLFQSWLWAVWGALVFDYVPPARKGTFAAGLVCIAGLVTFALTNLAGQWVKAWTMLFGPRGGAPSDYSAVYVLTGGTSLLALAITIWFGRQVAARRVQPLGRTPLA